MDEEAKGPIFKFSNMIAFTGIFHLSHTINLSFESTAKTTLEILTQAEEPNAKIEYVTANVKTNIVAAAACDAGILFWQFSKGFTYFYLK